MNKAEFWGRKFIKASEERWDVKDVRILVDEAIKQTKSRETTNDGVDLWLFNDGSVLRSTPIQPGVGHLQWTEP